MRSVFIISSDVYDRYQRYSYFFNWFEDHRDVSLCIWNKYASEKADIDELVPQLFDMVKNVPEWNAYIIDDPFVSGDYIEKDFERYTQCSINPYERAGPREDYRPEEDPLLRLVYYLGGRGVEKLEYLNHYNFKAVRPTGIFMITPRIFENLDMQKVFLQNRIQEKNRKIMSDTEKLLTVSDTSPFDYSDFWCRYEYPPNCRFLVFDMPNIENVLYEDSWFMFWMAVLTVALNVYNSSEIGAYKLYKLGIDISNEEFKRFINKYYLGLVDAVEVSSREIEDEIAAIKAAREDTTSNNPTSGSAIYVDFPGVRFDKFDLSQEWFGNTKDSPQLDEEVWKKHSEDVARQTQKLFKSIARGKNEAVDRMNRTFEIDMPLLLSQHLTRYDVEDMVEHLNASELAMLDMKTGTVASRSAFEKKERAEASKVKRAMRPRAFTKTYFLLMALGILISIAGFIPFMISSAKFSGTSFLMALLFALVTGGTVALASFIVLKARRRRFGEILSDYSEAMRENIDIVTANAKVQSSYLTALLDYMEKYQMIKSGKVDRISLKKLEQMTSVRSIYEDAIDRCKMIAGLCRVQLSDDREEGGEVIVFMPGAKIYLHDDTDGIMVSLNDCSERLETPFAFIEGLNIKEELIFGSSNYYKGKITEQTTLGEEEYDS